MDREHLLEAAQKYAPRAIAIRRAIHRHPEVGNQEFRTAECIAETLAQLDWEVSRPMGTSVVATLRGAHPGRTVAFRADMDALRIQEASGVPFASEVPGVMHACGHDFHTAGLLGAAMLLTEFRDQLKGCVKLFFQPDEENDGGARRMIAAACMENPHVDAVFGAHVDPDLPAGTIGLKYGKMYAAANIFRVTIHGVSCHGAAPENGVDAIAIGAQVVTALQQIVSRRVAPTDSAVITVGTFHAGTQKNVISNEAVLEGIIRTLGPETRQKMLDLFAGTVRGICEGMGASVEIDITESYAGIVNRDEMVELVRRAAAGTLGTDRVRVMQQPTMGTEDFGYFIQDVPGAFFWIGVGNPQIGADQPIHSPRFIADESAMASLMALHAAVALSFLED
ncbi:MAG: amidohydrolase [Clostridia bacterium]|nr:amidohydrolase [Clostridia bacterium]